VALWRRHDRKGGRAAAATTPVPTAPATEDLLFGVIRQTQQLNERLTRLEERVEASLKAALSQADSNDVIELRLHSARLAAELSRVTVELRAEIDELARTRLHERNRGPERLAEPRREIAPPAPAPPDVIDLTERRARQSTGWQPITDD
jgi:hypothetical protein